MTEPKDTTISEIPYGFCHCGCGQTTAIVVKTRTVLGHIKGRPMPFIQGHNINQLWPTGSNHPGWKGGKVINHHGYSLILMPEHPKADPTTGYVYEHILIAQKALGKMLPPKAIVHHHGPKKDQCLVICEDQEYHMLLHQRMRALKACGNANYRKCGYCGIWDDPKNMRIYKRSGTRHQSCQNEYRRNKRNNINYICHTT